MQDNVRSDPCADATSQSEHSVSITVAYIKQVSLWKSLPYNFVTPLALIGCRDVGVNDAGFSKICSLSAEVYCHQILDSEA